jgi:hypothetical protein
VIVLYKLYDLDEEYVFGAEINGQYYAPEAMWLPEIVVTEKIGEFESIEDISKGNLEKMCLKD